MPEGNGTRNPEESYTNKCQKHIACSYDYKLVCVDDKFREPFTIYLGKDIVYNFINKMITDCKHCSEVMKKHVSKEFVLTKEDKEDFKNSTKCWICDNNYLDNDVKVRDHCHITEKYRGYAHRDCNINLKLNHKIPVLFHNLENYDSYLIMQVPGIFNLKINVIPNGLEKYMSYQ